jgi:uncharacterized ParB-like nuclease family protein
MKIFLLLLSLYYSVACVNVQPNPPQEERQFIDIDERTDSITKVFKPEKIQAYKLTVKMSGYWNDTMIIKGRLVPKDSINNTSTQEYYNGFGGGRWTFKKYKATKYHIRLEYIFSEDYFEGYKNN